MHTSLSLITAVPDPFRKTRGGKYTNWVKYYVPGTAWIPNYSLSFLGGDVLAGLTLASILIPQSVSYATSLAQMSPLIGLFSASIPAIVYAFLGTCRQLNVAPEASLSLIVGQAVADILLDHPEIPTADEKAMAKIAISTIITMQVGLFSFLLGLLRLGFIDVVLSRALLRGFISAVAVVHPDSTFDKILFLLEHVIPSANVSTTVISFSALAMLVGLRLMKGGFRKYWWIYHLPEVLIVVIISTLLSAKFNWDQEDVEILGAVPIASMNSFVQIPLQAKNLEYLRRTTSTAILICVVGYLDSIVAAKQNASRFGYSTSPNRELVALGAANFAASFVPGTLPAWGTITRICLVVFSLLREAPHDIAYFWKYVLSCQRLPRLIIPFRMSAWADISLIFLTFFSAIFWNLEVAAMLSMIVSLLLVVHGSSKARMTILGRIPGTERWEPLNEHPEAVEDVSGALIDQIRENLDFANTALFSERLRRLELYGIGKSHPSEEPRRKQATVVSRKVRIFITHLRPKPLVMFVKAGMFEVLDPEALQINVADAIALIQGGR
ncbi:sulfate anion transporter [Mycena latifolia]|nr:sulfate anion transporter [Mycena latifolia]